MYSFERAEYLAASGIPYPQMLLTFIMQRDRYWSCDTLAYPLTRFVHLYVLYPSLICFIMRDRRDDLDSDAALAPSTDEAEYLRSRRRCAARLHKIIVR